jgi:microcystin-dependent protein
MPTTPTPNFQIPGPALADGPADIEAALLPMRLKLDDLFGAAGVEVGTILPYAGIALPDPPGAAAYAWADGGLIDRTTYATFFSRVQHAYNGGVDPGSNMVRLPDKRGRVSIGADSMGQGAANRLTAAAGHPNAQGQSGGEERHTQATAEVGGHGHADNLSVDSHSHAATGLAVGTQVAFSASVGTESADHAHATSGYYITSGYASGTLIQVGGTGNSAATGVVGFRAVAINTGGRTAAHTHAVTVPAHAHAISGSVAAATPGLSGGVTDSPAGTPMNVVQPYEVDRYIVRIA